MGSATIFSGGYAKVLAANGIKLKDDTLVLHGTVDPSVTNPSAPNGSIFLSTLGLYTRVNGAWSKLSSPELDPDYLDIETWTKTALADANIVNDGCTISNSGVINGANSLQCTHPTSGLPRTLKKTISVSPKFRNRNVSMKLWAKSNASIGNITVSFYDETNAATIGVSQQLQATSTIGEYKFSFDMPDTCASFSYTLSFLMEGTAPVTNIDDIQLMLTEVALSNTSVTVPKAVENLAAARISSTGTLVSTSQNFIQSIAKGGTGVYNITFVAGFFSVTPSIVGTVTDDNRRFVSITGLSSSGLTVNVLNEASPGSLADSAFSLEVTKQGADYINPLTSTETKTIPLTSSVLVTESDSYLRMDTATISSNVINFTNITSLGDAASKVGNTFVINKSGTFDIGVNVTMAGVDNKILITKNSTTTGNGDASVLQWGSTHNTGGYEAKANWSGFLEKDSVIRFTSPNSIGASGSNQMAYISYQGSTKILNPSSDQKVEIPTHELRFEGSSSRGSTDTFIVKFDAITKLKGDAYEVLNTAANGTVITMKKAGRLNVVTSVQAAADRTMSLTKNQSNLSTVVPPASEIFATTGGGSTAYRSLAAVIDVVIGDKIRVALDGVPSSSAINNLTLSLQETSVAVALQNVAPRWDDSDSAVRVQGGNGFGSTNTFVRRFSSVVNNTGTSVTYADSATLGASFTVNETGLYDLSYTDAAASNQIYMAITKNQINQTIGSNIIIAGSANGSNSNDYDTISNQEYLVKGDVIRAVVNTPANAASANSFGQFSISKVGKTQGTVDVTPFVQIPQNEVQECQLNDCTSFGSTATKIPIFINTAKNTNNGIFRVDIDSVNGTRFTFLKDAEVRCSYTGYIAAGDQIGVSLNASSLTTNIYSISDNERKAFSQGTNTTTNYSTTASGSFLAKAGDVVRPHTSGGGHVDANSSMFTITATAQSPSIATPTEQVSSDTMSFVFKPTAIVDSDPVGTFNTYTYAANTNTATISATAPTQPTSSMNVNGIQVFARAYNTSSTTAQPARVDIKIGKGLKSRQIEAYVNSGKVNSFNYDLVVNSQNQYGASVTYNELTGILSLNSAAAYTIGNTASWVGQRFEDGILITNGYFTFNASKSPSLVSIPNLQQRVAYIKDVKAASTNGGSSIAGQQTRELNNLVDNTGFVISLVANQFTLPAGTYSIEASAPAHTANSHIIKLRNTTDTTDSIVGNAAFAIAGGSSRAYLCGEITITVQKSFSILHNTQVAVAGNGLGVLDNSGNPCIYTQVKITKIK